MVPVADTRGMNTLRLDLPPALDRDRLRRLRGARPSASDFDTIIDAPTDAFDAHDGRLVFRFRKGVVPASSLDLARNVFGNIDARMRPSFRRKSAAGKLDVERIRTTRPDVVAVEPVGPGGFEGHFVLESGKRLRYPMSNPVSSFMAGYNYDRYRGLGVPTGFTAKHPEDWQASIPFFESIGDTFDRVMPEAAQYMSEWCRSYGVAPRFTIGRTCLSSVAVNVNYESCYHFDNGDLPSGYSTLTALAVGGAYEGGLLVLPRYRVAIDIRDGDLLCNQSHIDLHGNTAVRPLAEGAKRLSFVTYLKKMLMHAKPDPRSSARPAPSDPTRTATNGTDTLVGSTRTG